MLKATGPSFIDAKLDIIYDIAFFICNMKFNFWNFISHFYLLSSLVVQIYNKYYS